MLGPGASHGRLRKPFSVSVSARAIQRLGWSVSSRHRVTSHETEERDWLTIDLEESYQVEHIELFPRQDANQVATRQQFILQAAKQDDPEFDDYAILGARGPEPLPFQGVWVLNVEDLGEYRYIRFKRPTSPTVSGIAELRVLTEE